MSGWVKAYRKMADNPAMQGDARRWGMFLWLLWEAAWKDTQIDVNGKTVSVKRGEVCTSLRRMAKETGVGLQVVRTFIARLETDTVINTRITQGRTVITICNYDEYQDRAAAANTGHNTAANTGATQDQHTKEEGKKGRSSSPEGEGARKRATRLPEDWTLPREWGVWALEEGWPEDVIRFEADKFKDYWLAASGQQARKADWSATWRNWMRKVPKQPKGGTHERAYQTRGDARRAELDARRRARSAQADGGSADQSVAKGAPAIGARPDHPDQGGAVSWLYPGHERGRGGHASQRLAGRPDGVSDLGAGGGVSEMEAGEPAEEADFWGHPRLRAVGGSEA